MGSECQEELQTSKIPQLAPCTQCVSDYVHYAQDWQDGQVTLLLLLLLLLLQLLFLVCLHFSLSFSYSYSYSFYPFSCTGLWTSWRYLVCLLPVCAMTWITGALTTPTRPRLEDNYSPSASHKKAMKFTIFSKSFPILGPSPNNFSQVLTPTLVQPKYQPYN